MKRALLVLLSLFLVGVAHGQSIVGYPPGASAITASQVGSTGALTATLAATPGRTTYICGFVVASGGTTTPGAPTITVTGVVSGTMNFTYINVTSGQGLLGVAFPQCQPAATVGTPIVVNVPALGAGTAGASATAWGYQL